MSSMLTRLTGKGKKKDTTPPQEPAKKKRFSRSTSKKGQSSSAQQQVPREESPPPPVAVLRPTDPSLPLIDNRFISDAHQKRYGKIRTFNINQEKGFGDDLLNGVPELKASLRTRKWTKFNRLMIKDEDNPGNAMWVREFIANAYDPTMSGVPTFSTVVRGKKVNFHPDAINALLGCTSKEPCQFIVQRNRVNKGALAHREELRNIVCRPGGEWLPYAANSVPTRLSLTSFKPLHRAWGEFWLKNVRVVGNSSEIQIDNIAAVDLLVSGGHIDLGYWLAIDLNEMAQNKYTTFTLGHCNLITALCKASGVAAGTTDADYHPVRPLSLSYFSNKYERGPVMPRGGGGGARDDAEREEEEINRFEDGVHPDQQGNPENQENPAQPPPLYTHDVNFLAGMLHNMEISHYSGLPNMYYDTSSMAYSEAMTYRATFPPPTFGTLYPIDAEWEAHQAREMTTFQNRQSYNSSLRYSELEEIARRRRVEEKEEAAMQREMMDEDGLNLNLHYNYTDFFT
ncbi:hypothetical protein L195_g038307, partial [Trifolium pratense]